MKKSLILLTVLLLTLGMIGCAHHTSNGEETDTAKYQEGSSSLTTNDEETDTAKHQEESSSLTTTSNSIQNEDIGETDLPPLTGCAIEHMFYSVEDLNTYITTGSRNIEDYLFTPDTPLEDIPDAKMINTYYGGYHSIYEYFTFEETSFDYVAASFTFTDSGNIIYKYYLDNVFITVRPAKSDNLLECYKIEKNIALTKDEVSIYTKNTVYSDGHVLRENVDCSVMYYVINGVKKEAGFLVGDSFVTINGTWRSDKASLPNDYNAFMANIDTIAFSSFFSDDDHVFSMAISKLQATTALEPSQFDPMN